MVAICTTKLIPQNNYILPTQDIYVFCTYVETSGDYNPV
jgi:hypothetical protein